MFGTQGMCNGNGEYKYELSLALSDGQSSDNGMDFILRHQLQELQ